MATWDGSYGGPHEDPNYYAHSQQSSSQWNYYNNPTSNPPSTYGPPRDSYQTQFNPSILHHSSSSHPDNPRVYFENNRYQSNLPPLHSQTEKSNDRSRGPESHLANSSNLHPGANEFVPSGSNVETSKIFFADNRSKSGKRNQNKKPLTFRQDDYQRNSYRNPEKNRRPQQGNHFYSNPSEHEDQVYPTSNNYEDGGTNNVQTKEAPGRGAFKGRRARSHGRFQNDRYSRQFSSTNEQSSTYQKSPRPNNPVDQEAAPINRQKSKKDYSDDPRDERYRKNVETNEENLEEEHQAQRLRNRSRRQRKTDPREDCYRSQRDFYDEKPNSSSYKEKQSSYQDYNGHRNYPDRMREIEGDRLSKEEPIEEKQNWRQKNQAHQKKHQRKFDVDDAATQKERLTEQLNRGKLECLVCCDYIRQTDSIWSCNNCYHVLHLKCIKKWAETSQNETGWRCPACQNINLEIPEEYFCFCGKTRDPEWNRRDIAHSCGEICGRSRAKNNCVHKCTLLCHPGSCPMCIAMVTRLCGCGRMSQSLKCSTDSQISCNEICKKLLNCGLHTCEKKCHQDDCGSCEKTIHQECHCGKETRESTCLADTPDSYSCEKICEKLLECGNHKCKDQCHPGDCGTCSLEPNLVTHCCCGQTPLSLKRENCLDPIPTCDKICAKRLRCGQPSDPHTCKSICHSEECPQCESTTWVKCRCGNMDREIPCSVLTSKADDARCEKKCTKKRSCGKHKCNQHCCIDIEHICPLLCSKTLGCGRHKCELTCHKGRCQPCYRSSFEELFCECGAAVIYPPVACGTRKPTCNQPCSRQHACGHEVLHNCHSEQNCPPCTILTLKYCYGKHELRKAVPCYLNEFSCGMPCAKPISCGRHKCITLCHAGSCEKSGQVCVQPCTIPREMCGHICGAPCHEGKCPDTPCKEMVKVTCICGHRSMTRVCAENSREFQRIASGILASKMADMQLGHSVDLEEVFGQGAKKQNQLKTLECNDECKIIERNRKLALGLQIVNPDLSGKLQPRYSDFMKQWAKKDPPFCQMVHDRLAELVQLAKTSKQKSRSYSFDSMNRDKRTFVHEACEHFGCESQAYDQEPKRNVVATAVRDKCWMPSYSLLEMVQRENGQRKVPRPMLNMSRTNPSSSRISEVLPSNAKMSQKLQPTSTTSRSPEPEIDYFDFPSAKWSTS